MWPTGQIGEPIGTSRGGFSHPLARSRLVKTDRGRPHSGQGVVSSFLPLMDSISRSELGTSDGPRGDGPSDANAHPRQIGRAGELCLNMTPTTRRTMVVELTTEPK